LLTQPCAKKRKELTQRSFSKTVNATFFFAYQKTFIEEKLQTLQYAYYENLFRIYYCISFCICAPTGPGTEKRLLPSVPVRKPVHLSSGQSGTGANIDVLYHKIYWRINPDTTVKYLKGYVQTNFKTIQDLVSAISFDLRDVIVNRFR
jgi:hypothetical protein